MRAFLSFLALFFCAIAKAAAADPYLALNEKAFVQGREYFVLRSGRAKLLLQADRGDFGPAFTWLVFDAENPHQSRRKSEAFNFRAGDGFISSALTVELGGYGFAALGHRTSTAWTVEDGVPAVRADWWAGGVKVTETISAIGSDGLFRRTIGLDGAGLMGPDHVTLKLALPRGKCATDGGRLSQDENGARLTLWANGPARLDAQEGTLSLGPVEVAPGRQTLIETWLAIRIPGSRALVKPDILATAGKWKTTSSVTTTDRTIQELFDKARFGLPGMVADNGAIDAGIFEYGAQWVRDSSNTAQGLIYLGQFELARATLARVLTQMYAPDGRPMTSSRFEPPAVEELDEMGEVLQALGAYRRWTGDDSLIREHRAQILALVARPLLPQFRDASGLVHTRREYWERTFDDAYELIYQVYVSLGLREAAEMAPLLGAEAKAATWRAEADRTIQAMLTDPTKALVRDGYLIKRRNLDGKAVDELVGHNFANLPDAPNGTETHRRLDPDASEALAIALGAVDPHSNLARKTLDRLELLWNLRWSDGGYDRYNTSSEPDQPGPWPLATAFLLCAQHDAGLYDRSRRSLEWLNTAQGGRAGAWFEEIPSSRRQASGSGLLPWTSAEVARFVVRHYLGIRFEHDALVIQPALYPRSPPVEADLRYRQGRLQLRVDGSGPVTAAWINGIPARVDPDGALRLPAEFKGGEVRLWLTPDPPQLKPPAPAPA